MVCIVITYIRNGDWVYQGCVGMYHANTPGHELAKIIDEHRKEHGLELRDYSTFRGIVQDLKVI